MIKIKQQEIDNIIREIGKISLETISNDSFEISKSSPLFPLSEPIKQLIDSKNKIVKDLLKAEEEMEEKIQNEKLIFEIASSFPETYKASDLKINLQTIIKKIVKYLSATTGFFIKKNPNNFEVFVNHINSKYLFKNTLFEKEHFSFLEEIEKQPFLLKTDCKCPIFSENFQTTLFINFKNDIFSGFLVFCFTKKIKLNQKKIEFLETIKSILTILLMKFFSYKKKELKKQEFENMMNASESLGVIITDSSGIITNFSKGATKMLGYEESEVVGLYTPEFFHLQSELKKRKEELDMQYKRAISQKNVLFFNSLYMDLSERYIYTLKHKNQSKIFVEESIVAIRDFENKIMGFLFILSDITSIKQSFNNLQKSLKSLEELNDEMMKREMKIIELKKEINKELEKLGKEPKYLKNMKENF